MLSRVANSIYWMSRYIERADNVARFIDVFTFLNVDMGLKYEESPYQPIVLSTGDVEDFDKRYHTYDESSVTHFLTFDRKNPNSIISCINRARENARTVREIISSEMWENINAIYLLVEKFSRMRKINDFQSLFSQIHQGIAIFWGNFDNTMSHGEGWHFARMSQMIERADKTARILDVKYFRLLPEGAQVNSPLDTIEWSAVLRSVNGFEMYCKQFHRINYRDVTNFLIFDEFFPRSIHYCINSALHSLAEIYKILALDLTAHLENKEHQEINKLKAMFTEQTIDDVLLQGLHEFIDSFQYHLNLVGESISDLFFTAGLMANDNVNNAAAHSQKNATVSL